MNQQKRTHFAKHMKFEIKHSWWLRKILLGIGKTGQKCSLLFFLSPHIPLNTRKHTLTPSLAVPFCPWREVRNWKGKVYMEWVGVGRGGHLWGFLETSFPALRSSVWREPLRRGRFQQAHQDREQLAASQWGSQSVIWGGKKKKLDIRNGRLWEIHIHPQRHGWFLKPHFTEYVDSFPHTSFFSTHFCSISFELGRKCTHYFKSGLNNIITPQSWPPLFSSPGSHSSKSLPWNEQFLSSLLSWVLYCQLHLFSLKLWGSQFQPFHGVYPALNT